MTLPHLIEFLGKDYVSKITEADITTVEKWWFEESWPKAEQARQILKFSHKYITWQEIYENCPSSIKPLENEDCSEQLDLFKKNESQAPR